MIPFEVYNATLWKIVMAINSFEKELCTVQLIRAYGNDNALSGIYSNRSQFLDTSIDMMRLHEIPIFLIDYSIEVQEKRSYSKIRPGTGAKLISFQ